MRIMIGGRWLNRRLILLLVLTGFTAGTAFAQSEVTIVSDKDNTLYESSTGALSNGAGIHFFAGRTNQPAGQSIRRGLIFFNIADSIEPGATIDSVVLKLTVTNRPPGSGSVDVELHKVSAEWGEGTSNATSSDGQGTAAATGDATWIHTFFNTTSWTSAGGDFSSTVSATQSVAGVGSYEWGSTSGMVSDVQGWLDDPDNNFGWIVIGDESTNQTARQYATHEIGSAASRPNLKIFFTPLVTSVENENGELPSEYNLAQNFPNPFNPVTTIAYQLPQSGRVSLIVYDLLGAEVATLVNSVQSAGIHSVRWNAANVASGIYFYRLRAGSFTQTRKLVVIK